MVELSSQRHPIDGEREGELRKLVGQVVDGRYRITELLGTGGMGAVYEAEHLGLGRQVAIKFIDREYAQVGSVAVRFTREARAASSIESEHIVSVHDAGTSDGRPYLVMELLRGEDLGRRLRRCGKLPVAETLHIAAQALRGLADAHEARIVHRDLKPDNLFLVSRKADRSFVKIVDFGISKIERSEAGLAQSFVTRAGTVLGTPLYMSPEQAQAAPDLDARADLYSLGAIMFECITGRPPHVGESHEQIIMSICMSDAPDLRAIDPHISPEVARVVERSLRRDRSRRFVSARQMLVAVTTLSSYADARHVLSGHDVVPSPSGDPRIAEPLVGEDAALRGAAQKGGAPQGAALKEAAPQGMAFDATLVGGMGHRAADAEPLAAKTLLAGGAAAPPDPSRTVALGSATPAGGVVPGAAAEASPRAGTLLMDLPQVAPAAGTPAAGTPAAGTPAVEKRATGTPAAEPSRELGVTVSRRRPVRMASILAAGIFATVTGAVLTMWGLPRFFASDRPVRPTPVSREHATLATHAQLDAGATLGDASAPGASSHPAAEKSNSPP